MHVSAVVCVCVHACVCVCVCVCSIAQPVRTCAQYVRYELILCYDMP